MTFACIAQQRLLPRLPLSLSFSPVNGHECQSTTHQTGLLDIFYLLGEFVSAITLYVTEGQDSAHICQIPSVCLSVPPETMKRPSPASQLLARGLFLISRHNRLPEPGRGRDLTPESPRRPGHDCAKSRRIIALSRLPHPRISTTDTCVSCPSSNDALSASRATPNQPTLLVTR